MYNEFKEVSDSHRKFFDRKVLAQVKWTGALTIGPKTFIRLKNKHELCFLNYTSLDNEEANYLISHLDFPIRYVDYGRIRTLEDLVNVYFGEDNWIYDKDKKVLARRVSVGYLVWFLERLKPAKTKLLNNYV